MLSFFIIKSENIEKVRSPLDLLSKEYSFGYEVKEKWDVRPNIFRSKSGIYYSTREL